MSDYKIVTNEELNNKLRNIDTQNIQTIQLRKVGLLDVFGKILIDIKFKDNTVLNLEVHSPVDTNILTNWLDTEKLLDITTLYEF